MSVIRDIKATKDRFAIYIEELSGLLREYHLNGTHWYDNLKKANKDPAFVTRRDAIWKQILEQEGGKLTFGSVLAIIGAVLGGVGIAAGGGAFGLPLVLLLAPVGVWIGNEIDDAGLTREIINAIGSWFGQTGNQPLICRLMLRGAVTPDSKSNPGSSSPKTISSNLTDADRLRVWQERMRAR